MLQNVRARVVLFKYKGFIVEAICACTCYIKNIIFVTNKKWDLYNKTLRNLSIAINKFFFYVIYYRIITFIF